MSLLHLSPFPRARAVPSRADDLHAVYRPDRSVPGPTRHNVQHAAAAAAAPVATLRRALRAASAPRLPPGDRNLSWSSQVSNA